MGLQLLIRFPPGAGAISKNRIDDSNPKSKFSFH